MDLDNMPKQYTRSVVIYEKLLEDAEDTGEGTFIWTGFMTEVFKDSGVGKNLYSTILKVLQSMGCISQLQRGGGTAPSVWVLHQAPAPELYRKQMDWYKNKATAVGNTAPMAQRIAHLEKQVEVLADELDNLKMKQHNFAEQVRRAVIMEGAA